MATLRERVERQRSIQSSINHDTESNSLEGLNLERGDPSHKVRCIEQLDNQVISTLHQDVAALSIEVLERFLFFFFQKLESNEESNINCILILHLFLLLPFLGSKRYTSTSRSDIFNISISN